MPYQDPNEIMRVTFEWLKSIVEGRRPGKIYLDKNKSFGEENGARILQYCSTNYGYITFESLDKSLDILARSNRLVGFESELPDGDISKPSKSKGSLSLESNGGVQSIISKILNGRVSAEKASSSAEAARKSGFKQLPNRDLSEDEIRRADPRAIKTWLARRRGKDAVTAV